MSQDKLIYKLSTHILPRKFRPDEITFIKKVSNYLVIFYRGNYGDIFDVSDSLKPEPLFDLYRYDCCHGIMVDIFLYYDREEDKELLVGYTNNRDRNHIIVYDLTGENSRGDNNSMFIGFPPTLTQTHNGEIILSDGENKVILKGIHWSVSSRQYESKNKVLVSYGEYNEISDPDFHIDTYHNSVPHREAHLELSKLYILDESSLTEEQKYDLFTTNLQTDAKYLQSLWSYYNDGKDTLYCGHGIWLTEWKLYK